MISCIKWWHSHSPQEKCLTKKYTWCIFRYIGIKSQSITTFISLINKQVRHYSVANKVTLLHICQSPTAFIMFDVVSTIPVNIFSKIRSCDAISGEFKNLNNLIILKIYRQLLVLNKFQNFLDYLMVNQNIYYR